MPSPIAICSLACLFPQAPTLLDFLRRLQEGTPTWRAATAQELGLSPSTLYDARKGTPHRMYCLEGGFVEDEGTVPPGWESTAWQTLDPSWRWSLQVARQALREGGIDPDEAPHSQGGLILGNLSFPTRASNQLTLHHYRRFWENLLREEANCPLDLENSLPPQQTMPPASSLQTASSPVEFIQQQLGLGPCSFALDAACASSLYAIRLACLALEQGEAEWILAGAVSAADPFFIHSGFSLLQAYPEENSTSRPLDVRSQGLYASEGVGLVLLRRLDQIPDQGPKPLAIIPGSGWSNDGRGKFVLSPNPKGQHRAYERAYAESGILPKSVNYLECHATGTPLGDRIEAESLQHFFGAALPLVGSVKSNVGHMLTAAGMSSLAKILLSMREDLIPPSICIENPLLPPHRIVRSPQPWLAGDQPRIAAISSFGFGGTNAHLLVQDQGYAPVSAPTSPQQVALKITGLEACFGLCQDRVQLRQALEMGTSQLRPLPPAWQLQKDTTSAIGSSLEEFEVDLRRLRLPPHEQEQLIPQQLLALKLADRAIMESQIPMGSRVAVLVAMETDSTLHQFRGRLELEPMLRQSFQRLGVPCDSVELEEFLELYYASWPQPETVNSFTSTIGNLMASRIAALYDFHGPAFTVSSGRDSVARALQIAQWLANQEPLDGVVVVAVDLACHPESQWNSDQIPFGDGGGAVVLQPSDPTSSASPYPLLENHLGSPNVDLSGFGNCRAAQGMLELTASVLMNPASRTLFQSPIEIPSVSSLQRKVRVRSGDPTIAFRKNLRARPHLKKWLEQLDRHISQPVTPQTPRLPSGFHLFPAATVHEAHRTFLKLRQQSFDSIVQALRGSYSAASDWTQVPPIPENQPSPEFLQLGSSPAQELPVLSSDVALESKAGLIQKRDSNGKLVVFDQQDLLEFAGGRIAQVFGQDYALIDTFARCVRLPLDPYLLVTRVTELEAQPHVFKPCRITTEYDIPSQAWFATDGQIPWAVAIESGQCDLLLISYLGIDFENRGERVYRLLDCTMTFLDRLPHEGQTLRYEIHIDSFARHGGSLLFFFHYECFVGETMVLRMDNGCAGFFTQEELDQGKGVIHSEREVLARAQVSPTHFVPLLQCDQTEFDRDALLNLVQGVPEKTLGPHYAQPDRNHSLRMAPEQLLMSDRITRVQKDGGPWGLGLVESEKDLRPDDWYFTCHFLNDPVLAGSLMAEGCVQLLQFYMLYLGLQTRTEDARFEPLPDLPQIVRCRGQVTPHDSLMRYRLEVKEIGLEPEPFIIANIDVLVEDRIVVDFRDVGVRLVEKVPSKSGKRQRKVAFDDQAIEHFAKGSVGTCFGEAYQPFDQRPFVQRNPCGELQLLSRVVEVEGEPRNFKKPARLKAEYDVGNQDWYLQDSGALAPLPASVLLEIGLQPCGFLGAWMGSIFEFPNEDLHFRLVGGHAELLQRPQLAQETILTEVSLQKMTRFDGQVLEEFYFSLRTATHPETPFLSGFALFGYFPELVLERQRQRLPDLPNPLDSTNAWRSISSVGLLDLLQEVQLDPTGGTKGLGIVVGRRQVDDSDWYYPCHFHDDPVMPGSLGIEAACQALRILMEESHGKPVDPSVCWPLASRWEWEFRGEVRPGTQELVVLVEVIEKQKLGAQTLWVAQALLGRDGKRIYRLPRLSLLI